MTNLGLELLAVVTESGPTVKANSAKQAGVLDTATNLFSNPLAQLGGMLLWHKPVLGAALPALGSVSSAHQGMPLTAGTYGLTALANLLPEQPVQPGLAGLPQRAANLFRNPMTAMFAPTLASLADMALHKKRPVEKLDEQERAETQRDFEEFRRTRSKKANYSPAATHRHVWTVVRNLFPYALTALGGAAAIPALSRGAYGEAGGALARAGLGTAGTAGGILAGSALGGFGGDFLARRYGLDPQTLGTLLAGSGGLLGGIGGYGLGSRLLPDGEEEGRPRIKWSADKSAGLKEWLAGLWSGAPAAAPVTGGPGPQQQTSAPLPAPSALDQVLGKIRAGWGKVTDWPMQHPWLTAGGLGAAVGVPWLIGKLQRDAEDAEAEKELERRRFST